MILDTELFRTAYVPNWYEQLDHLAHLTLPEPWRFKEADPVRKNIRTPILEKYIHAVYKAQVLDYLNTTNPAQKDAAIYVRSEYAVFSTGLMSKYYKPLYGLLERNKRVGNMYDWIFTGFSDDSTAPLKFIHPLPTRPFFALQQGITPYMSHLSIRVNVEHILCDGENVMRLPEWCREHKNLSLLLETAVETTRRITEVMPSVVVPQIYQGRVQYLMPIALTDPARPDLAMAMTPMDGYYLGATCLTLEMAYTNARLLAAPTVSWLTNLVEL